jgi:hypothetical protein
MRAILNGFSTIGVMGVWVGAVSVTPGELQAEKTSTTISKKKVFRMLFIMVTPFDGKNLIT